MFEKETVFILGAGASWHYNYPTGEELIEKLIQKAISARDYFHQNFAQGATTFIPKYVSRNCSQDALNNIRNINTDWGSAEAECHDLIQRLRAVDPVVIDYFLGQNPDLEDLGKFLIAWIILECEAMGIHRPRRNANRNKEDLQKDNWYRFIVHKLLSNNQSPDDLLKNKVSFVTFNYDVSLETFLFRAFSNISQFKNTEIVESFLNDKRVLHVYGQVRAEPFSEPPYFDLDVSEGRSASQDYREKQKVIFDMAYEASKYIKTIAPYEKEQNVEVIKEGRKRIEEAKCIYILGYGFDETNSKNLGLYESLNIEKHRDKVIQFTNFHDSNSVNKKAGLILSGDIHKFLSSEPALYRSPTRSYCEKSIRNVYEALALDFASPEEE